MKRENIKAVLYSVECCQGLYFKSKEAAELHELDCKRSKKARGCTTCAHSVQYNSLLDGQLIFECEASKEGLTLTPSMCPAYIRKPQSKRDELEKCKV